MQPNSNPFLEYNTASQLDNEVIPMFSRKIRITINVSEEAYTNLKQLATIFASNNINILIEKIGLYTLTVDKFETVTDPESLVTTDQCRQSGYEDGLFGNPAYFIALNGKVTDKFQQAYMRGFLEGNFVRSKR